MEENGFEVKKNVYSLNPPERRTDLSMPLSSDKMKNYYFSISPRGVLLNDLFIQMWFLFFLFTSNTQDEFMKFSDCVQQIWVMQNSPEAIGWMLKED